MNVVGIIAKKVKNVIKIRDCIKQGCKIGNRAQIGYKAQIGPDCIIGSNTRIANSVVLSRGVKIGSAGFFENMIVGLNSVVEGSVVITGRGLGKIRIGRDCYIGHHTALDFSDNVTIGNFVHIAGLSTGLWTHTSVKMCLRGIQLGDDNSATRETRAICVENNVYIGGNCTIYPGVTIGHHSVIAPNSAVTKDVPPYSMYGGTPARFIKSTEDMILDR